MVLGTFYSKSTGVEVKVKEDKIFLRFFTFGNGDSQQGRFMLAANESFLLSLAIAAVVKGNTNQYKLIHKFQTSDGIEKTSTLTVEKWERNGKSGFGVIYKRENEDLKINVPLSKSDFLYFGEILKFVSVAYPLFVLAQDMQQNAQKNMIQNQNQNDATQNVKGEDKSEEFVKSEEFEEIEPF